MTKRINARTMSCTEGAEILIDRHGENALQVASNRCDATESPSVEHFYIGVMDEIQRLWDKRGYTGKPKDQPRLVRYWYSPNGRDANNKSGWRMGTLLKTGRRLYHIQLSDGKVKRYRVAWTKIIEAEDVSA